MKKINSIIMIIILLLSIGITKVYAAYSCNVDITCSNTSIKKGDTVELVVSVSNIDAGEGIAGFQALLNYDSNVFSNVELEKLIIGKNQH